MADLATTNTSDVESGGTFGSILKTFQRPDVATVLDMDSGAHYLRYDDTILPTVRLTATQVLGSGLNGQVLLLEDVERVKDFKLAAKIFSFSNIDSSKNDEMKKIFHKECGLLQSIKHPNIIEIVVAAVGPGYGMIVLPYYPGGALYKYIGQSTPMWLKWRYFVQLLSGVEYLHEKRIVHRDLKPDNILVWNLLDVRITDFGLAEKLSPGCDLVGGFSGTDQFVAPEVLANKRLMLTYDGLKADVYALGIVLWCLLMACEPTVETVCLETMRLSMHAGKEMDPLLVHFTQLMLTENPVIRPTAKFMVDALKVSGMYEHINQHINIPEVQEEIIDVET